MLFGLGLGQGVLIEHHAYMIVHGRDKTITYAAGMRTECNRCNDHRQTHMAGIYKTNGTV